MPAAEPLQAAVDDVLRTVNRHVSGALGPVLLGLYAHGSLVAGDFALDRSDLDLLAVLSQEPDKRLLTSLRSAHERVQQAHPGWRGRIEVEYVALATVRAWASGSTPPEPGTIARVSPGELLHLLPASSHRLLTWASVGDVGRTLAGPPASDLLPVLDAERARSVLLDHVRDWPMWVRDMTGVGGQAYAVLTLCRARHRLLEGRQVSKRSAATLTAAALPGWAPLILWAQAWWYDGGRDDEPSRLPEVIRFVDMTSDQLLAT